MQSSLNEKKLCHLASNLGREWTDLASKLGFRQDEIDRIQVDNLTVVEQIFKMLVTWWHKDESEGTGALDALCDALTRTGRGDLARGLLGSIESGKEFIDICRAEFINYYKDTMGVVPLHPWFPSEVSEINDIYVDLKFSEKENKAGHVMQCNIGHYTDMLRLTFRKGKPVRYILLSGIAGNGKTTIVSKIANDWAQEILESPLSKFKLLVALSMRELESTPDLIEAIFDQILPGDTMVSRESLRDYLKSHADEVLVILDGADEFDKEGSQLPAKGSVNDIISGKILRGCTVIVTTRPHMINKLCNLNRRFVCVQSNGFPESGIKEYIQKFFTDKDPEASAKLMQHLMPSESLYHLAKAPMMLLLICLVWSDDHKLPETLTELFKEAIFFMLKHQFAKMGQLDSEESLLEKELMGFVTACGKAALDGLILSGQKLVFEASDFENSQVVDEACKIGILSLEKVRSKSRAVQQVTFFHKTFQEAIAGFYWASLVESDEDSFKGYLNQVNEGNARSLEYLLRFCCGAGVPAARSLLTHVAELLELLEEENIEGDTSKPSKVLDSQRWIRCNTHWLDNCSEKRDLELWLLMHLEAQSKELHSITAPTCYWEFDFDVSVTRESLLALQFLMKCAKLKPPAHESFLTKVDKVVLTGITKDSASVVYDILTYAVNVKHVKLQLFNWRDDQREKGIFDLGDALCHMHSLTSLLISSDYDHPSIKGFEQCIHSRNLQKIVVSGFKFVTSFSTVANQFSNLRNLKVLAIEETTLDSDQADCFVNDVLPHCVNLRVLSVCKSLHSEDLLQIVQWACTSSSLIKLELEWLSEYEFSTESESASNASADAPMTQPIDGTYHSSLEILHVTGNHHGLHTALFMRLLKQTPSLKELWMFNMGLTNSDGVLLAEVLQGCQQLEWLDLCNNDEMGWGGLESLLKVLSFRKNLGYLSLPDMQEDPPPQVVLEFLMNHELHKYPNHYEFSGILLDNFFEVFKQSQLENLERL